MDSKEIQEERFKIATRSNVLATKSLLAVLFNQTQGIPEDDFTLFNDLFKKMKDHYRADQLFSLREKDPSLADLVDDFDWDAYEPLEITFDSENRQEG